MEEKLELNLIQRLNAFKQEDIEIVKNKKAYGYMYAPLDAIIPVIKPLLLKHGIGYYHYTDSYESRNYLITVVHSVDQTDDQIVSRTLIDGDVVLAKMNKFMVMGSAMTYFRRYHLVVMLDLLTDEDSDAGGATPSKNTIEGVSLKEGEMDYVGIFTNHMKKNKTEKQVRGSFDIHKKSMSKGMIETIEKLIIENFKVDENK